MIAAKQNSKVQHPIILNVYVTVPLGFMTTRATYYRDRHQNKKRASKI